MISQSHTTIVPSTVYGPSKSQPIEMLSKLFRLPDTTLQKQLSASSLHHTSTSDGDEVTNVVDVMDQLQECLGPGPLRYAPSRDERPVNEQLASLTRKELRCVENLQKLWEARNPDTPFSAEMYLRFARCSPGKVKFNQKTAWNLMKKFNHDYLSLTAEALEQQLDSKVRTNGLVIPSSWINPSLKEVKAHQ
jgi:hypothetical protein